MSHLAEWVSPLAGATWNLHLNPLQGSLAWSWEIGVKGHPKTQMHTVVLF